MIITNCPRCGSMNITTAGTCANCGWSQFAQVTVSSGVLLGDYKRLLLENRNLKERIAELGLELGRKSVELGELVGENILWKVINDELKSRRENLERENDSLQEKVSDLLKRIAELEALVEQLIWVGNDLLIDNANPVTVVLFNGLVAKAKEKEREE